MSQYFLVFGSHPALSLAEFSAVYPEAKPILQTRNGLVFDLKAWDQEVAMKRLGGVTKLGEIIYGSKMDGIDPETLAKILTDGYSATGLEFGWSVFGHGKKKDLFSRFPIKIKKALKDMNWKVRWVTGKGGDISPAAVAKCHLTEKPNFDACMFLDDDRVYLGRTAQVQDADAWSLRDYGRPHRDDENGMLPPKLARMMVNLAKVENGILLDPFCGSGTILMEAALSTKADKIIGGDIEPRQIKDTDGNNRWLVDKGILYQEDLGRFTTLVSDAKLIDRHLKPGSVDAIVTEGWLGRPLKGRENENELRKNAYNIKTTWTEALPALSKVLKPKGRLVAVIPSFKHNKNIIDPQKDLDFTSFGLRKAEMAYDVDPKTLYYEREGQHLRRNILVLEKASQG